MKKTISFVLIITIVLSVLGVSAFSAGAEGEYVQPEKFIYGDVNFDGNVTTKDVTLLQRYLANIIDEFGE